MSAQPPTPQDNRFFKILLLTSTIFGGIGVSLGALAAHLPARAFAVPGGREALHSAVDIIMWHVLALCTLGLGRARLNVAWARRACTAMLAGLVLFSVPVTLYALTNLTIGPVSIARVAPWGGTLLIVSWLLASIAVWRA